MAPATGGQKVDNRLASEYSRLSMHRASALLPRSGIDGDQNRTVGDIATIIVSVYSSPAQGGEYGASPDGGGQCKLWSPPAYGDGTVERNKSGGEKERAHAIQSLVAPAPVPRLRQSPSYAA